MLPELGTVIPKVVELPEGRVRIWSVRPGVVFTQAAGRMVIEHAEHIMAAVDRAIVERPSEVVVVHDMFDVESYEVNVHTRMSAWSVKTFRSVRRVVIGVRSPFVALAVRTINLAVSGRFEMVETNEALLAIARRELAYTNQQIQLR